jgi:hypothetical protein
MATRGHCGLLGGPFRRQARGLSAAALLVALGSGALIGCSGGDDDDGPAAQGGTAGTTGGTTGGSESGQGGTSASGGNGGAGGTSGATAATGGKSGSGGSSAGSGAQANAPGAGGELPTGDPGCGLDAAAFCDNFDEASDDRGRAGELDRARWSGSHMRPDGPTAGGDAFGVPPATLRPVRDGRQLPACRAGLGDSVFPDDDALICDPSTDIASRHLLVAVSSQNYGQNSYRVRQPFDFAGRTGKVVFDAEAMNGGLLGWISLDITEDPIGAPSFQTLNNLEGGVLPRSGLSIQFAASCNGAPDSVSVSEVHVFSDYEDANNTNTSPVCVATEWGKLNHFEVSVAGNHVEVMASEPSADGTSFGGLTTLWSGEVSLPFTRGYVQITTHNHATLKYSAPGEDFGRGFTNLDAWLARWDNVGFDGPVVSDRREYEVPDALAVAPTPLGDGTMVEGRNIGYLVPDEADGQPLVLEFDDVDLDGVTQANIALSAWYCAGCGSLDNVVNFKLRYRLNGNEWIDRPLNDKERANITVGNGRGAVGQVFEAPLEALVAGKNTLELVAVDIPQNYPPGVANVDLVLLTD